MTRTEFDQHFRAHTDNTDGYTKSQLELINDAVFAEVSDLDIEDEDTKTIVDHRAAEVFFKFDQGALK